MYVAREWLSSSSLPYSIGENKIIGSTYIQGLGIVQELIKGVSTIGRENNLFGIFTKKIFFKGLFWWATNDSYYRQLTFPSHAVIKVLKKHPPSALMTPVALLGYAGKCLPSIHIKK